MGALTFGLPSIARDFTTGELTVRLRLRVSSDLENFATAPFEQGGMTLLPSGALEFTFPAPADRAFFTLEAE